MAEGNRLKLDTARVESEVATGFFRDGVRRIDVVIVVADDSEIRTELFKVNFLLNTIKAGLQIECEPGVILNHSNLLFVKVHAPDAVLDNFADYYDMHAYFKESRLQFVKRKKSFWQRLFPGIGSATDHEREWIKIVRSQYGPTEFSNIERSRIVYRVLVNLPFGDSEGEIGILRLLEKKVVADLYALHDGPYFFLNNQDMWGVNARQLLYYNWVKKRNMFKLQPLCLVHEYFGDRVSLYFAFFSFYNHALIIAAFIGILVMFCEVFDTTDQIIVDVTCEDNATVVCPQCRMFQMCPFKRLSEYCLTAKISNLIDNPFTFYYSVFVSIWAICFIGLWRRKESYWAWLWELSLVDTIRPNFKINYNRVTRSTLTGILKAYESPKKRTIRVLLTFAIVFICILTVLCVIALMIVFKYWMKLVFSGHATDAAREYAISAFFGGLTVLLLFILDICCRKLSYTLTAFENHRNQSTYERSLIIKLYVFTVAFTFSMLVFFSYIKGAFYTYPSDPSRWYTLLGIGMMTCSPYGCLDEVWILLSVTLIVKQIALRAWYSIRRMRTDYSEGVEINTNVPCWEREYRLKPVTEAVLIEKYRELVTQFGVLTLFVAAFPLAPACALIANVWDVRFKAREFLLGSRRPLLPMSGGLGAWRDVLLAVAYATALTNGLTIALTTKTIQRFFYLMDHDTLDGFLHSTLSVFDVSDYLLETGPGSPSEQFANYDKFKPDRYCLYPGYRYPPNSEYKYEHTGKFWKTKYFELVFIFVFEHAVFVLVFIFHYVIPAVPRDIQDTLAVENRIKSLHRIKRKWKSDNEVPTPRNFNKKSTNTVLK